MGDAEREVSGYAGPGERKRGKFWEVSGVGLWVLLVLGVVELVAAPAVRVSWEGMELCFVALARGEVWYALFAFGFYGGMKWVVGLACLGVVMLAVLGKERREGDAGVMRRGWFGFWVSEGERGRLRRWTLVGLLVVMVSSVRWESCAHGWAWSNGWAGVFWSGEGDAGTGGPCGDRRVERKWRVGGGMGKGWWVYLRV